MEARLEDLESRLAFQDQELQTLNSVVIQQGEAIERLGLQLERLRAELERVVEQGEGQSGHERPPHY